MSGVTLKPGWIPVRKMTRSTLITLGLYFVATYSQQRFTFEYYDAAGQTIDTYVRNTLSGGLEADCFLGKRFYDQVSIGLSIVPGYKPRLEAFPELVQGLDAYRGYAPAQGYANGNFYLNLMACVGYNF
jgi:hypothetical protein